ncbi:MAG TPA: hypothetical protein VGS15_11350 [Candidatus Acidoferrales bacterium]|nr:hypothetical protein [Candidatus Acidoferrales bacterium]
MSDFFAGIVILPALSKVEGSERSLPAVAGESKDFNLPRLAQLPLEADPRAAIPIAHSAVSGCELFALQ